MLTADNKSLIPSVYKSASCVVKSCSAKNVGAPWIVVHVSSDCLGDSGNSLLDVSFPRGLALSQAVVKARI